MAKALRPVHLGEILREAFWWAWVESPALIPPRQVEGLALSLPKGTTDLTLIRGAATPGSPKSIFLLKGEVFYDS